MENILLTFDDFNTSGKSMPEDVKEKVFKYHIIPLTRVMKSEEVLIKVNSGWRPLEWELSHGRDGKSQHTFINSFGAVDITFLNFEEQKYKMLNHILKHTNYSRIALYATFMHCDYKVTIPGDRRVYTSDNQSNWTLKKVIKVGETI